MEGRLRKFLFPDELASKGQIRVGCILSRLTVGSSGRQFKVLITYHKHYFFLRPRGKMHAKVIPWLKIKWQTNGKQTRPTSRCQAVTLL